MSKNLQTVATGTVHPCKCCGTVFTVERNPNRSGEFCSRSCALQFSRTRIRSFEQRQADDAKMMAGIRERQERDRAESAKRHAEDLAQQKAKSDAEWAAWEIRQTEIAREYADEERRRQESDHRAATSDVESAVDPFLTERLDCEMLARYNSPVTPPRVNLPAQSSSRGIYLKPYNPSSK